MIPKNRLIEKRRVLRLISPHAGDANPSQSTVRQNYECKALSTTRRDTCRFYIQGGIVFAEQQSRLQ
jgi:hypothetical protein